MIMKYLTALVITGLLLVVLAACPPPVCAQVYSDFCQGVIIPGGINDHEIVIGQFGPDSGPTATWGMIARGTHFYFDMINAQGGIHGRRIRHLMVDDHYNPQLTRAAVKDLAETCRVFALVGGVGAEPCLAVADYIFQQGIPWIGPVSGIDALVNPPKKNIFGLWPRESDQAGALAEYAVQYLKKKTVAVIYQNDLWGEAALSGAVGALRRFGLRPRVQIPLEIAEFDLRDEIAQLKEAGVDALIMWVNPTHAILLRREAEKQQFDPVWMTGALLSDSKRMHKMTGRKWRGTIFTAIAEPPDSKFYLMEIYRRYFQQHGPHGQTFTPFFYMGMGLAEPLVEALHHCGPEVTREKLIIELEKLNHYQGIIGQISYSPDNRRGQPRFYLAESDADGQPVRIGE